MKSKLSKSSNIAPSYYMFKDHKSEGGYRQVVGGCSSNTLRLSNLISEVIESVASAIENSYQVIGSEDLLARISDTNDEIKNMTIELNKTRSPRSTSKPAPSTSSNENDVWPADDGGTVKTIMDEIIRDAIIKSERGPTPLPPFNKGIEKVTKLENKSWTNLAKLTDGIGGKTTLCWRQTW